MVTITSNVDLEASFKKLLSDLKESLDITQHNNRPERYARAYGKLESSVKHHIVICTDLFMSDVQDYLGEPRNDPDDLKHVNI
jgi:hypothetical protein